MSTKATPYIYFSGVLLGTLLSVGSASVLAPQHVLAHSLGASFEATSSPYRVDVGYDPVDFLAGDASRFDFDLREESGPITDYDYVWVRITKEKKTLFATGIERQTLGPTTLVYTFDTPGDYVLHVSYRQGADVMAEASFPFTVLLSDSGPAIPADALMGFGIGAVLSIAAASLWLRLRRVPMRNVL